jgi:hypothetical protein
MPPLLMDGRAYEPIPLDLVITRGEDWHVDLDWLDADGNAVSVEGMAMTLRFDRSALGGVYPPDLTSDEGGGITLTNGHVALDLSHDATANYDFFMTTCWLELTTGTERGTWSRGKIRLRRPGGA